MNGLPMALVLTLVVAPGTPSAQDVGHNAALRYWMAFASMENPPADEAYAMRLETVAEGDEPWDDDLAPLIDKNLSAIETMHRGARLSHCDWGLEYELLAETPIAHIALGRALSRLNVLHVRRLLHEGRPRKAIEAWVAGVRFSRHVAADGPWLGALVAAASLEVHLGALETAFRVGPLDEASLLAVERELAEMPEDGFDWSVAARHEASSLKGLAEQISSSDDPVSVLGAYFAVGPADAGPVASFLGLSPGEVEDPAAVRAALRRTGAALDLLGPSVVQAFQRPYEESVDAAREIDAKAAEDPVLARVWPLASRMNERRGRLVQARADLLALVRSSR